MSRIIVGCIALIFMMTSCSKSAKSVLYTNLQPATDTLRYKDEVHFKNVKQLTFGGDNAEAYWSFDNKKVVFQATNKQWGAQCDQIYYFDLEKWERKLAPPPLLSTGLGRTTCSFFMPGNRYILDL